MTPADDRPGDAPPPRALPNSPLALDDDQRWFEALAGREPSAGVPGSGRDAARAEAAMLRDALRAHLAAMAQSPAAVAADPATGAADEQALVERARRAGLFGLPAAATRPASTRPAPTRPGATPPAPWPWRWFSGGFGGSRGLALAAGAAVAVTAGMLARHQEPAVPPAHEVLRGLQGSVIRLDSAEPAALQTRWLAELAALGISATPYERLGRLGIDADLPQPLPAPVTDWLARNHLPTPPGDVLRIEIGDLPK